MRLDLSAKIEGIGRPLGAELLRIHRNYQPLLASIPQDLLKGAAHITGGGLVDNIPRILPAACDALVKTSSWSVPAIFRVIQRGGTISTDEMYEVFNMGIGMVLVVSKAHAEEVLALSKGKVIGQVTPGSGKVLLN
jgi:phosphoribosylformylglycinamidine cyclo-ligase